MLSTKLCGIKLDNPTILASGILGVTASSLINAANNGAGAVTTKSISLEERKGHSNPVIVTFEGGMINAVGLSSPGIENGIEEVKEFKKRSKTPIIASIFASKTAEFGEAAKRISEAKPDLIEVNISCPNVEAEFGKLFAADAKVAASVTEIVKNSTKIPVFVKLSPNVSNIKEIAKAVEAAGADGITAVNTAGPGMVIDIKTAKPILHNKMGGISGAALRPIAVRCVYDIYETVKIPIIGTGGITNGRDAVEMLMAGATAVGIGSGVYYRGIDVFKKVCSEIEEFMKKEGYKNLKEIIGKAHEN
ncbi:MAG: dihydroorotate dehydrogenase [Candidatus Woesearchaeota archaeon]|nr:dihydroorotate dehydrogenase [Candidatus Woesearchaeota archaeon]